MSKVDEIKNAIEALPQKDYTQLRQWFTERDWQNWDMQIETASDAGELDFLIKEALDERDSRTLKEL